MNAYIDEIQNIERQKRYNKIDGAEAAQKYAQTILEFKD